MFNTISYSPLASTFLFLILSCFSYKNKVSSTIKVPFNSIIQIEWQIKDHLTPLPSNTN